MVGMGALVHRLSAVDGGSPDDGAWSYVAVKLTQSDYGQDIQQRLFTRVPNIEFLLKGNQALLARSASEDMDGERGGHSVLVGDREARAASERDPRGRLQLGVRSVRRAM